MTRQYTKFRLFTHKSVLTLLLLVVAGVQCAWGQNYYVFQNSTYGYICNNNGTLDVSGNNGFSPSCVWIASGALANNNNNLRSLQSYTNTSQYFIDNSNSVPSISTSAGTNRWRIDGNSYLCARWSSTYYIKYDNGFNSSSTQNSGNRFTTYSVKINQYDETTIADPTISIAGVSGNEITFDHTYIPTSYHPAYTLYQFSGSDHYWYNNTDHVNQDPTITLNPTYTWSVISNLDDAEISSDGKLTIKRAPTENIVVRLTVSNLGQLGDKIVEYTLTRATVNQVETKATTLDTPTITPTNAQISWNGSQAFTGSATATTTTTTVPAHVTLTGGGDTYYYYNGALYTSTDGFTNTVSEDVPQEDITYSWTLADGGSGQNDNAVSRGHLTPTSGTGSTFTVNYPNASDINRNAVLTLTTTTVNQTTGSSGSLTKTATTTVTATQTQPTAITADVASITICQGSEGTINYTLTPAGAYNHVTVTSTNDAIAYYTGTAATDGTITIHAGNTVGTATLTLTAAPGVTTTVTVTTQEKVIPPAITFNNTTNQLTISSETAGATIYYTTDGHVPTTASTNGTTPVTFTISATTAINAMADKDGLCNSGEIVYKTIEKLPAPTITVRSDGLVEMTCATAEASILYTTDGTTPTLSSTYYNNPIKLSGTVKAIAIMTDHINSEVTTQAVQIPAETPRITISPSGSVTISCDTPGATIYYTTDGSEPTTSSTQYTGQFTVSNGVTVKAIAVATGYAVSEVASNRFMLDSGVSGTTVVLNDAEDHLWSYYSDPDCPVRSLSPADVMITYYGDGIVMTGNDDYTSSTTSSSYVVPGNTNYVGGAKVNVGGENENTFVYYKTLERGDATQTAYTFSSSSQSSAASRCPYTPIPNPFQVRPTYGGTTTTNTADWSGWRGFQCWRLKSVTGGAVYSSASGGSALSTGAVINANTQIYFAPNSEYGMEVEFEAVWARAYVVKASDGGANAIGDHSSLGYERNFIVLNTTNASYNFGGTSGKRITNINRQVTVSNYLPNGVRGQNNDATYIRGAANNYNLTLQANTKFENVAFNMGSYTLTADGHDLIVGRGCSGTVDLAQGVTSATNGTSQSYGASSYTIRIESGTFNSLLLTGGSYNTNYMVKFTSTLSAKCILGCDYDRASGDNSKLSISPSGSSGTIYGGKAIQCSGSGNRNNLTFDWYVKSGKFHDGLLGSADGGDESIYIGSSHYSAASGELMYFGKRRITVEGGNIASLAGGVDDTANDNVSVNDGGWTTMIRVKNGTIRGSIYGAAAYSGSKGDRTFVITGGTIGGWVAGGANGTQSDGGLLDGASSLYVGGNTSVNSNSSSSVINRAVGGNVFGAGCGYGPSSSSGQVTNGTTVVVADEAYVERGVYGGGSYGYTTNTANIYILGGTVDGKSGGVSGTSYQASINGGVFGGACQNDGGTVNITMKDGQVNGGIYGGSNATGTCSGNVTMQIDGGQVGTSSADAVIHGGGLGNATRVLGSVNLTLGASTTATDSVTVYGDVYGGSAQGKTNGNTSLTSGAVTNVTLNKGDIHGSLYGGGLGNASYPADVYGPVTVVVNGGSVTNADGTAGVFGCNNVNGAPQSTVTVTVTNTNHAGIDNIFGGGNHADYPALGGADYPTVTMTGGLVNNSVFGGGNEADIKGNANVSISGGTIINRVFGGGNLGSVGTFASTTSVTGHTSHSGCIGKPNTWTVGGTCTVTVSGGKVGKDNMSMPQDFGYVFGASRGETKDPAIDPDIDFRAYVKETDVTISGTALIFGGVYGGSENGHVRGNTHVKIQGGQIGCGDGMSTAYTETQWSTAATAVKSGNAAGINSAAADMPECAHWRYQNPYLPYDMNNATAGGAPTGSDGHTFYGNVFGGGSGYFPYEKQGGGYEWNMNAGLVEGNTKVEITGGHILTSIYGGNEMTNVTGDSCVVIMTGGTLGVPRTVAQTAEHPVTCYLFGAGKGDQRTHFNESTNVNNVRVKVGGNAMIYGSIFGGGEDGHVKGNAKIEVTGGHIGTWGTTYVDGNIFGGGRGFAGDALTAGVVQGNVTINISGGTMLGSVYGGGRLASVGTYLVATDNANYGKLMGSTGDTDYGNVTITISGGTIGNTFEYIVPSGNWNQTWKNNNNIPLTEFGTADTDANRLMHTKGGNVFGGSMGRLYQLNGITPISDWPDLGKVRKTEINISGGTIKSNVYGGGELGTVAEGTTINITGGTIGTEVGETGNPSYTFGSVFGGGYGSEDNINGSLNDTRSIVNSRDHAGLVTGNTDVNISGSSTRIWASVYGGGELAKVNGSTDINIAAGKIGKEVVWHTGDAGKPDWANDGYVRYGGYRMGNVFGGGKGSLNYTAAGLVTGNAKLLISGGNVYHNVYGGGALGSVGTFTDSGGNTTCAENTGQTEVTITGGTIGINGYDNGMVDGASRGAGGNPDGTNIDRVAWVNNSTVKIGTDATASYADFTTPIVHGSVYGGGENGHNYGYTQVNIFSGTVGNATGDYDHGNIYGAGCGTDTYTKGEVKYNNPEAGIVHGTATVNVKGGHVMRNIYGGGSMGTTQGKATVNITGGRVGSVFGGPKGKEGALSENDVPFAYCGVETEVDINYTGTTPASDEDSTTQLVTGSVYGGGEAGNVKGYVVVNMKNGLVLGDLYGGGALADTNIDNAQHYHEANETVPSTSAHTTTVNLTGGTINGSVYGGGLGRKNGINGATSDKAARVYGDVTVELNKTVATDKCWVMGKIFGCNNLNGTPKGHAKVHIYKTVTKNASDAVAAKPTKKTNTYELSAVYGGGNMAAYEPVSNTDFSEVIIEGCDYTSIETVYGGGNAASAPATEVTVNSCYEIGTIFGGGNGKDDLPNGQPNPGAHVGYKAANYTYDSTKTREENIAALDAAFESQKSSLIYGTGVSKVNATGGTIHQIFGSSNTKGNVRIASNTYIDQSNDDCCLDLGDVYGGGNEAYMDGGSSLKLGCIDHLHTLYGGANAADVGGDIELTITSGRFDRVFGGNNVRGTISGSITVNVEETGCHPIVIGELYGCGNQAPYKTPGNKQPTINAKSFTSIGRIFGGGLGATAIVEGSPTVNVNEVKGKNHNGDVAAGSYDYDVYDETANPDGHYDKDGNFKEWTVEYHDDATAPTTVTSSVTVPTHTKGKIGAIGTIFGGGNAAKVDGSTTVNIGTATDVYLVKPVTVGTTNVSTFYTRSGAGTTSSPYAYTQASGTAVADTTYYEKKTVEGADIRGNVFGGGNAADVTGNTSVNIGK